MPRPDPLARELRKLILSPTTPAKASRTAACLSSNSEHWCTPPEVLQLVRAFAGPAGIGLDPCSNEHSMVGARREYRLERGEDGLVRSWLGYGLVYANPPYGHVVKRWACHAVSESIPPSPGERDGAEILLLTAARTDTRWFNWLLNDADATCYWKGRITFYVNGRPAPYPATFPSAMTYFGPNVDRFEEVFQEAGRVVRLGKEHR